MKLERAKGVRDFAPQEKIARQDVVDILRSTFELYGFSPIETPVIERFSVLSSKYAGGDEILKETFRFIDQGGRELGLRYDFTVPLCRFIGMNPSIKQPFKAYQIGTVFRDGPIKTGRYREFWQCDADIIGPKGMMADAECIQIAQRVFKKLRLDVVIGINSRKVLDSILEGTGIEEGKRMDAILSIDKLEKIGKEGVRKELGEKGIKDSSIQELLSAFEIRGTNKEKIEELKKTVKSKTGIEGIEELKEILGYIDNSNVEITPSLARGLSYYTGTVFEVFLKDRKISSSLSGGGRYDRMIGSLTGQGKEYPAVGISFGLEPITEAIRLYRKGEQRKTVAKVYIIPIRTEGESMRIADRLREAGINTSIDIIGRGPSKNMDYANSMGIPYVMFIGEKEIKAGKVNLRDMESGEETLASVDDIIRILREKGV